MEKLLREKNVISFLVAAICIEIFYWFHIAESFLLFFCCCRVVRSRSSVRASPSKLKEWNGMKKKNEKSRMGECHKNRNWTMLHLILSMRSHRSRMHRYLCMLKNEHPSEMYCIDIVDMWFSFSFSVSLSPSCFEKGLSFERESNGVWVRGREEKQHTQSLDPLRDLMMCTKPVLFFWSSLLAFRSRIWIKMKWGFSSWTWICNEVWI